MSNKRRPGKWYCEEDGTIVQETPLPVKRYTQKDKRLYNFAVSSESPEQTAERRKLNGKGLQRYTRYL